MISKENVSNNKVVQLIEIYNFSLGHFFILICLNNLKLLNLNSKWIYKLKRKKKGKRKKYLSPNLLGPACLPPPVPLLPFQLGRGPAPSPTSPVLYPSPALDRHI
jgi:hypothetical protein